jgi:hypothetical protein
MKKDIPNLPASSKLQKPSGPVGPSIKGALKSKPLAMSGGVPSKGAKSTVAKGGVSKNLVKKAK